MNNRNGNFPTWYDYINDISTRFGKPFDDPLSDLVGLHQGSKSTDEFLDKFECTLTRMRLPEAQALSIFLTNINPHLALHVRQFSVRTVAKAARIARLRESSLLHVPTKRPTTYGYSKPYFQSTPKPLISGSDTTKSVHNPPLLPNPPPNTGPQKIPRKFSYEEMQDRKARGLCMFCEEPYTPGHQL